MDEQLAAIYGTGQPVAYDQEDLQKTAAAELLVKLAAEQGVDLNQFSDQEIGEMITDLYKSAQEEGAPPFPPKKEEEGAKHEAEESPDKEKKEEEKEKEAQAKFAEADFLGRVMAHAMVQELNNIDKKASAQPAPAQQPTADPNSALEKMAQKRAWEMAKEAGYVDDKGNLVVPQKPEQQKTAAASPLQQNVDVRALQILEAAGLPVEWNK